MHMSVGTGAADLGPYSAMQSFGLSLIKLLLISPLWKREYQYKQLPKFVKYHLETTESVCLTENLANWMDLKIDDDVYDLGRQRVHTALKKYSLFLPQLSKHKGNTP